MISFWKKKIVINIVA